MRHLVAFLVFVAIPTPAVAWNEHGHMVVARLAWRQLTEDQRAKVTAILKKHPHYDEYLAARKPDGFNEDEWMFMQAAIWSIWVCGKRDFDHPTWHTTSINQSFRPATIEAEEYEPPDSVFSSASSHFVVTFRNGTW